MSPGIKINPVESVVLPSQKMLVLALTSLCCRALCPWSATCE